MNKWSVDIKFDADPEWRPMTEVGCWFHCPLRCLIGLGEKCKAKAAYDKEGLILCPIYKYGQCVEEEKKI